MTLKLVPDNTNIGFVRMRYWAFALTIALTLGSLALIGLRGLNLGVDNGEVRRISSARRFSKLDPFPSEK